MQTSWQTFLDRLGARRDSHAVVEQFPGEDGDLLVGDHLSIIRVRGEETEKFLHGQLTCDLAPVFQGHTRLGMHLSLKGRAMTSFRLLPADGGVDLVTPKSRLDDGLAALKKYALFSKVTLEIDSERVPLLALGDAGAALLRGHDIPLPGQPGDAQHAAHTGIARLENGQRYLLLLDTDHAQRLLEQMPVATIGAARQWRLSDIAAGEAHIESGAEDLWLPQVLNYDALDGISFKKGCYLGQEVVARMHFKGTLKQRMQRRDWPGQHPYPPGQVLRDAAGKAVGELVISAIDGSRTDALVVLRLDHSGDLFIDQQPLNSRPQALPYALPPASLKQ